MSELLNKTEAYILQEKLFNVGDHIVIAVSGGPDSMTLLDLLSRLKEKWQLTLQVAHLNHQLRPNADSDAAFVQKQAERYKLPIYLETEDVAKRAKTQKQSLEEAARYARRAFLKKIQKETSATRIALGHTKSDQAETVLMRLIRGSGLTGLGGIRPLADDLWIRPLLSFSRREIEAYVASCHLETRHDETNSDPKFVRNRIRNELVPLLETNYNPQIEDVLTRASTLLQEDDAQLELIAQQALSETVLYRDNRKIILDVTRFFGYHISLRRRLIKMALFALQADAKTTEFRGIERIHQISSQQGQSVHLTPQISAYRAQNTLIIMRPAQMYHLPIEPDTEVNLNGKFSTQIIDTVNNKDLTNTASEVFFDLDHLPSQKLILRPPKAGDKFQPFGMQGQKKIGRLFNDHKIPRPIRLDIPLLISGETILWVAGIRRSQIAPILPTTKRALKATFKSDLQSITF